MSQKKQKAFTGKISTVINILLCIILLPVIFINVTVIINSYLHPNDIPGIFGIKPVAVLSGSMEDTFMTGDLIFIKETDPTTLKKGDVICYLVSDQAITHRIVDVTKENGNPVYTTKGDANNSIDQNTVKPEQIQGIWSGIRWNGMGDFIVFLSSTTGMIIFILCPILLLIIFDVIKRWKSDKDQKNRTAQLEAELETLRSEKASSKKSDSE